MELILQYIINWGDAFWLLLALFAVHKPQRVITIAYILSCMLMLRLQVELMLSVDHPNGFLPLIQSHVMVRGLIVYSIFHGIFLLLARYSPGSNKHVFLAASISIFFAALLTSTVIMVL